MVTPEQMQVIINIQAMQLTIGGEYQNFPVFENLRLDELRELQDKLIPLYNETINERKNNDRKEITRTDTDAVHR